MGLTSRYSSKKKEKQEMEEKIDEAEHTLEEKDAQLAKLQEQEKALEASFVEAVGENKFKDFLLKVSADGNGEGNSSCACVCVYAGVQEEDKAFKEEG